MYTPRRSEVWARSVGNATTSNEFYGATDYSVWLHLFTRGRYCYAARATRWTLPRISS